MGPANLLFLLLATATQLSVAQLLIHRTAKPSTVWINTAHSYGYYLDQVPVLTCYPQPQASSGFKPAITAGFLSLCVSDTCDVYLFAVFLVHVVDNSTRVADSPQVLWSANRNRPVREKATLEFSSDGNLVLRDADGSHVWSSNSSGRSVDGMVITEIGNLVLFDRRNATVWQSFDYPTDTMVPGQSLVEGMRLIASTSGYLAPEWLTSRITEKVDVYSFGVVVMEIVCGRKNIDDSQPEENVQLINLLREKAQNSQLIDLIDKHSDDMISHQEEVIEMMKLAIWCLQNDSIQRPSMSTVIKVLEGVMSAETFEANSIMFVQDNPSTYSVPSQASILSGPR